MKQNNHPTYTAFKT